MDGVIMASNKKWLYMAIGVIIGLILFAVNEWLAIAIIVLAIGIPAGAYMMLDSSQRRRYREIRRRNQLGR
jgi:uncharacterized membrane protein